MKLPYDLAPPESAHNVASVKTKHPTLGIVLDLQNQDNVYSVAGTGVARQRVTHESKILPSLDTVAGFCDAAGEWLARHPNTLVAVHCHYGFNRTGFLLVSYLVEREGWGVDTAIAAFEESRPPGIKHQTFKDELRRRYATTPTLLAAEVPAAEQLAAEGPPRPHSPTAAAAAATRSAKPRWCFFQRPWAREEWAAALVASAAVALAVQTFCLGTVPRKLARATA
jgi:protein-tyrosine phosphatase